MRELKLDHVAVVQTSLQTHLCMLKLCVIFVVHLPTSASLIHLLIILFIMRPVSFLANSREHEIQFYEMMNFEPYCQLRKLDSVPLKLHFW